MTAPGSDRGRLVPPDLDDRRWDDLVADATDLIERYAPQLTTRAPSDPALTLVELFAYLVEQLIYRLNQVPAKSQVAFLNLLGITRAAAVPARTLLTFTPIAGRSALVPKAALAQTKGTESQPPVVFQTEADCRVVPAAVEKVFLVEKTAAGAEGVPADISAVMLPPEPVGTRVDLTPPARDRAVLLLGFTKEFALPVETLDVYVEVEYRVKGVDEPIPADLATATWTFSSDTSPVAGTDPKKEPKDWPALAVEIAPALAGPSHVGRVRLRLPAAPAWAAQNPAGWNRKPAGAAANDPARRWIGLVLQHPAAAQTVTVRRLLLNTVPASTALTAGRDALEVVGAATGNAQVLPLRNRPVFLDRSARDPLHHVEVQIDGSPWRIADPDTLAPGTFHLDPSSAEITFAAPAGRPAPPRGSAVTARYRHVASGAAGNVAAGAVTMPAEGIADIAGVTNPVRGAGGQDEEPVEAATLRGPRLLRTRDRAITAEDYEFLARQAAPGIAKVRCLPAYVDKTRGPWTFAGLVRAPGNVQVLVVPEAELAVARPEPSVALVQQVLSVLDAARDVTAALRVSGPRYLAIKVFVRAKVFPGAVSGGHTTVSTVETDIRRRVTEFLHPTQGGNDDDGWEIGQNLYVSDVYRAIKPDDHIGYISELRLTAQSPPPYHPAGLAWDDAKHRPFRLAVDSPSLVRVTDYELVCFGSLDVGVEQDL
ncbi:baseplate J/gp47 family protein [Lentzea sp. BCCO 10_0061]|uniref:Baseplate J/gp47 family protein n=1 Tax=Lentzea sokolovensis TaxID=3095429 RepID=A0ABU4V6G4_9PSEU|nr:baseplate J/gp47 family protein [Lentzea sp. BCCO 10_0061]MDX8147386.1 baseplate J/gp47 family protein [Lentzea sp. BCCO 10_0061]